MISLSYDPRMPASGSLVEVSSSMTRCLGSYIGLSRCAHLLTNSHSHEMCLRPIDPGLGSWISLVYVKQVLRRQALNYHDY